MSWFVKPLSFKPATFSQNWNSALLMKSCHKLPKWLERRTRTFRAHLGFSTSTKIACLKSPNSKTSSNSSCPVLRPKSILSYVKYTDLKTFAFMSLWSGFRRAASSIIASSWAFLLTTRLNPHMLLPWSKCPKKTNLQFVRSPFPAPDPLF